MIYLLDMVKNKGFLPSAPSEIPIQRKQIKSIIFSLLAACKDPDDSGIRFEPHAIIANPPAYGMFQTFFLFSFSDASHLLLF